MLRFSRLKTSFENTGKAIYKIGVNFSTETRKIDEWKIAYLH